MRTLSHPGFAPTVGYPENPVGTCAALFTAYVTQWSDSQQGATPLKLHP